MAENSTSRWSLGWLAPRLLALALLADVASRFVSYDVICFRPWEAVTRFRVLELGGPFEPNRQYRNEHTYGALASMGNYPALRHYHPEVFTTDAFGFRNAPQDAKRRAELLVIGSSFTGGAALSDAETLPVQLAEVTHRAAYNASGADLSDERQLRELDERLDLGGGVVVHEYVDGSAPLSAASFRDTGRGARERARHLLGSMYPRLLVAQSRVSGWLSDSPLKLLMFKGFKAIENDSLLPNSFASNVTRAELANGEPMLFHNEEAQGKKRHDTQRAVEYWRRMTARLARHGLRQLVVLVPNQYAVYWPLTRHGAGTLPSDPYLDELERRLRDAGVPVVNLTPALATAARDGLSAKCYVYWPDDTHWNARGVRIAAEEIAKALETLAPVSAQ